MDQNKFNFTYDKLAKIQPPKEKRVIYKDLKELGLLLIVSYGGSKVFYLGKEIEKKYHRIKIGNFPNLSIEEARIKAIELKNQIAKGINPAKKANNSNKEEITAELDFCMLFEKYIEKCVKKYIEKYIPDPTQSKTKK